MWLSPSRVTAFFLHFDILNFSMTFNTGLKLVAPCPHMPSCICLGWIVKYSNSATELLIGFPLSLPNWCLHGRPLAARYIHINSCATVIFPSPSLFPNDCDQLKLCLNPSSVRTYKQCIALVSAFSLPHVRFLSANGYKNCALLWIGSAFRSHRVDVD